VSTIIRFVVAFLMSLSIVMTIKPSDANGWYFSEPADFTHVIFVGDSLTAGYQSGGLCEYDQINGYAAQLARQAEFDITLPLVRYPGIPPKLVLGRETLEIKRLDGFGERIDFSQQVTNLAVPGQKVNDALRKRPSEITTFPPPIDVLLANTVLLGPDLFEGRILSQVEWAEVLNPTFIFLWIGNNDVLQFATSGGTEPITPFKDFKTDYLEMIDRLENTGADIVVANIPDVTSIPFFTSAEEIADQVGVDLTVIGPILGIRSGDFVTLEGLPLIEQILADPLNGPLSDEYVFDALEFEAAQDAVSKANKFIAQEALLRNIPLVNINLLFKFVEILGVPANGKRLTTDFLGGLFSLDGVHPTNTGYAVVANHFIRTLNRHYRARIPWINISEVAKKDPLVIPELLPDMDEFLKKRHKFEAGDPIRSFTGLPE